MNDINTRSPSSHFREHLTSAQFDHRFARDFAVDALADDSLPDVSSWTELSRYLRHCGACRAAVVGAIYAWRQYRGSLPSDPRPP